MARNNKGGLGRGLNSLLGGYEAPLEQPSKPSGVAEDLSEPKEEARKEELPSKPQREVIREEDLAPEDRETLDGEKYSVSHGGGTAQVPSVPRIPLKDVVAKRELIEESDGVTIKGVVDRPVSPAARYMEEPIRSSAIDIRIASIPAQSEERTSKPTEETESERDLGEVPIEMVHPNPKQPRMHFNKEELDELASSISKDGLLQPILVREVDGAYEIIAGERRWQACQIAGLTKVPVRIKEADDMKVLELALIENLQRSDLNPIEEAYGYKRMMERGNRTQSEVANAVSKGRSTIANALRLLDLPEDAQQLLYEEKITAGHARAILAVPSDEGRAKLTEKLTKEKLSVRETEALARLFAGREKRKNNPVKKPPTPKFYRKAAKKLTESFDTKVRIRCANGKNKIEIEFKDEDDLHRLYDLMEHGE